MECDSLAKLGITLKAHKSPGKIVYNVSNIQMAKNIKNGSFKNNQIYAHVWDVQKTT